MATAQAAEQQHLIGGSWRPSASGSTFERIDPFTGEPVTTAGLAAVVFAADEQRGLEVAGQIDSGICHVNGSTVHDEPPMPFGGVKASGWGRFGGTAALHEFTDLRWITVQEGERHYPI
jgi:acyl-CoA reductase-like NAD-dependent aldehyde dehydrogenase